MTQTCKLLRPVPTPPDGVSMYFFYRMCFLHGPTDGSEWYNFKELENLPPYSCKYPLEKGQPISFIPAPGTGDFCVLELPLLPALQTLSRDEWFNLNPARWDGVKQQLSEGTIEHPWMTLNPGGRPMLQDGRHRIVTMIRLLGLATAPFVVEEQHVEAVKAWFDTQQPPVPR